MTIWQVMEKPAVSEEKVQAPGKKSQLLCSEGAGLFLHLWPMSTEPLDKDTYLRFSAASGAAAFLGRYDQVSRLMCAV